MAGQKNYCVVVVNTGLTEKQASNIIGAISKVKNSIAPQSRSTAAVTTKEGIGALLQKGIRQITN